MIAVICSVRYDYMVEEVDAHNLTTMLDALCQFIVILARCHSSARVVVNGCENGCVTEYGFTHDYPYIYACLGDSALADFHGLDKFVVVVHQHDMELLYL